MPAEVISTIHQLAVACKKYKGILFTNKNGNVINDTNDPEREINIHNNLEVTWVEEKYNNNSSNDDITGQITGVWKSTGAKIPNMTDMEADTTGVRGDYI